MKELYDLRDWFYECDRLLFLAEVHYHKKDVVPSGHKFSHELTSSCLEKMFNNIRKLTTESDYCLDLDTCSYKDDMALLKQVLDNISSNTFDKMDEECVLKAQSIVHELANVVNSDILEISELHGYPHIYNACKIR